MELEKLKIPCIEINEKYETQYAKVENFKNLRITSNASDSIRIYILWSFDCNEIFKEDLIMLESDTWKGESVDVIAPFCKLKILSEHCNKVERVLINVLGRDSLDKPILKKEVKIEDEKDKKDESRHKSPFRRFVSHKKESKNDQQKNDVTDKRFPGILFKNSLIYVSGITNCVNTLPFPVNDGNHYVLTVRNNYLEWRECNSV